MEIKNLRYFLAVVREENMSHAAEMMHVTQPTLSKALKSLEEELGKKLFTRHSFSIKLTDEGMLLRDRAEDLVAMADKIEQEFVSLDDITGGDIYFGLAESYQIRLLAREIKKLKDKYPSFTYHITSGDTEQVTEKLDKGLLDFAVICDPPNTEKYEYLTFPDYDRWGVVMLTTHPLAKKKEISIKELSDYPVLSFDQGKSGSLFLAEEQLSTYDYDKIIKGNDRATMLNLMVGLNGYTLCSGIISEDLNGSGYAAIPLKESEKMRIGYIKRKDSKLSELGQLYIDQLSKYSDKAYNK